jgi:predicted nucleic acid-binding protein
VDTNVVSYMLLGSELGERYRALVEPCVRYVTPVTIAEMHYGAHWRGWGVARWKRLEDLLDSFDFLAPTPRIAELTGHLIAQRRLAGRPITSSDAWIAATAIVYDFPLVTHDGDFAHIEGLQLLSEHGPLCVAECRAPYGRSRRVRRFRYPQAA